jgi:hypothetical protein
MEYQRRKTKSRTYQFYEDQLDYLSSQENASDYLRWLIDNDSGFKKWEMDKEQNAKSTS